MTTGLSPLDILLTEIDALVLLGTFEHDEGEQGKSQLMRDLDAAQTPQDKIDVYEYWLDQIGAYAELSRMACQ